MDISPFHSIDCNGIANVKVHFGQNHHVTTNIPNHLEKYLNIAVRNEILYIETKPGQYGPVEFLVDVFMQNINTITISGIGNIELDNGRGTNLTVINNGIGNFNGNNYQTERATVTAANVGNIKVWATDELEIIVSGIGSVYYRGNPKIKQNRSGLGRIIKE
jgi:hypothetical protein